jgi:hypothetical protein
MLSLIFLYALQVFGNLDKNAHLIADVTDDHHELCIRLADTSTS